MATIVERKRKDGTPTFMAQIVVKRDGVIAYRENKTFTKKREAVAWGAHRETELAKPGAVEEIKREDPILSDVIDRYIKESKRLGRTKEQVLGTLKCLDIAKKRCSEIRSEHIVAMATELSEGRHKSTVASYMTFLSGVFKLAKPAWGYPLDISAMEAASTVTAHLELTGRSDKRERRPTVEEMNKLMEFFSGRRERSIPMTKFVAFALFSTRRQGEIIRIRWADLDEAHSRILVRDAKDPRGAAGNHIWCELPPEALRIIKTMPRVADAIFPYKKDTINYGWRDACKMLGINTKDTPKAERLRFHDLRHEGVSRLCEMGRTVPQVASVSGHRSWQNLQRYSHLRATGDKWADWPWLERVCQ